MRHSGDPLCSCFRSSALASFGSSAAGFSLASSVAGVSCLASSARRRHCGPAETARINAASTHEQDFRRPPEQTGIERIDADSRDGAPGFGLKGQEDASCRDFTATASDWRHFATVAIAKCLKRSETHQSKFVAHDHWGTILILWIPLLFEPGDLRRGAVPVRHLQHKQRAWRAIPGCEL